jgi:hypothetical protein
LLWYRAARRRRETVTGERAVAPVAQQLPADALKQQSAAGGELRLSWSRQVHRAMFDGRVEQFRLEAKYRHSA